MNKTMRVLAVCAVLALGFEAHAIFKFEPLPAAPKADDVGEVMFDRSDRHSKDDETVTMEHAEFVKFFSDGKFHNEGTFIDEVYRSGKFAEPKNAKGGWMRCSGAFATKSGKVFKFNRARVGVLEIEDSKHQQGWLVIEKEVKKTDGTEKK